MKTSAYHPGEQDGNPRLLLVQCCRLPQFFYIATALRQQFPDTPLDALVIQSDDLDFYLSRQNPFSLVLTPSSPFQETNHARIFFPLLNRGYRSIKRVARRLSGPAFEVDYQGRTRPLSSGRLALSILYPLHQPDEAFRNYFLSFPHRPLGKKVLFVESCHPSLVRATEPVWRPALPDPCELTRLEAQPFLKALRQLRGCRFDSGIVFFSGEQGYSGIKLLPFLLRVPRTLVINESGVFFYATFAGLLRFLYQRVRYGSALPPRPIPKILFLQTEDFASCRFALTTLKSTELFPDSEIVVLCREENSSGYRSVAGVDRVLELRKGTGLHNWRTFRRLRLLNPDIVSAVFSGRPVFRKAKLLFFFLCDRPSLVFNAAVECYFLGLRTLPRLLAREPFRFRVSVDPAPLRSLVVQTEHARMVLESIRRLRGPQLYPKARCTVVCRPEDSSIFEGFPGVERVFPYPRRPAAWLGLARRLYRENPSLVSVTLSGRRVFSLHKLLVLALFPFRPKLVFNARLDAYWLNLRSLPLVFQREPLLLEEPGAEIRNEILLIQTDSTDATLEALQHLQSGQAVGPGKIRLLCREEDRQHFLPWLEETDINTWTPGISGNLRRMIKVAWTDRDVVTAVFSGQPIFRLQKLAFFLLPARDRLVFNENMDCFYLTRSRLGRALRLPSIPVSLQGPSARWKHWLRQTAKIVLWIPRFAYLLGWLTVEKLRRARRLQEAGRLNQQP